MVLLQLLFGATNIINILRSLFITNRSAYHSSMMNNPIPAKVITALLPLFREHANNPAMIHHAMMLIKKQTEFLNPGKLQ